MPAFAQEDEDPIAKALKEVGTEGPPSAAPPLGELRSSDLYSTQAGGARLRLIDVSLDGLFAVGTSTETDESLQSLDGGGHDPRTRGFTVQNVALSFMGAVGPSFTGEAHIVYFIDPIQGESVVELEEAFLTTQQLPFDLQIKAGTFFTEFGRLNPTHPHAWEWVDQPVINTRLFGPDGMRGPGARISWLVPLPWYSGLYAGVQNANGETMASFLANEEFIEERPFDDRPFVDRQVHTFEDLTYSLRWENGFDVSDEVGSMLGVSGLRPELDGIHRHHSDLRRRRGRQVEAPLERTRLAVRDLPVGDHAEDVPCRRGRGRGWERLSGGHASRLGLLHPDFLRLHQELGRWHPLRV
jgi:hypothetical protein